MPVETNIPGGPRIIFDEWGPITNIPASSPAPMGGGSGFTDNSQVNVSTTINNNTINVGGYGKRFASDKYLSLAAAFGGGLTKPGPDDVGVLLDGLPAGTSLIVADAYKVTDGSPQVDCRIWVRFEGEKSWWPLRGGSLLTGWPFSKVYASWPAQADRGMMLKVWTDGPVDRTDVAGS